MKENNQLYLLQERTVPEAIQAKFEGAHIIVISIGIPKPNMEITGIASDPEDACILNVTSFAQLPTIKNALVQSMCDSK